MGRGLRRPLAHRLSRRPTCCDAVYQQKALQVMNEDSRQRIVSRRVLTPKGASDGGGGGAEAGSPALRKDFRPLAFWLGSVETDANGRATHGRHAARVADDVPHHGRRGRRGVAIRIGGRRDPRHEAGDAAAGFPALPGGRRPRVVRRCRHQHAAAGGSAVVTIRSLDPACCSSGRPTQTVGDRGRRDRRRCGSTRPRGRRAPRACR